MKGKATRVQTEESGGGVWEHMKAPLMYIAPLKVFPSPLQKGPVCWKSRLFIRLAIFITKLLAPSPSLIFQIALLNQVTFELV